MRYAKEHRNFTGWAVINKDYFSENEWSRFYIVEDLEKHMKIERRCKEEMKEEDCYLVVFKYNKEDKKYDPYSISLNLYYDIIEENEQMPSVYKLLLDLLNIQSILFGLNFFQLLVILQTLSRTKCKLYLLLFSYIICTVGSLYQTYEILNEIINGELTKTQYYEIMKSIKMPDIIFCFDFYSQIDNNYKLTGSYLERLTFHLRTQTVFNKFVYLNESNQWSTFEIGSNIQDEKFSIETFFFLSKNCFKIRQKIEFHKKHFYFGDNTEVLKIYFITYTIHAYKKVYFLTNEENTLQLSRLSILEFDKLLINGLPSAKKFYFINHVQFEVIRNDKFNFIKNPLSVFYGANDLNDGDKYLLKLKNEFETKYNLRTTNLPIEKNDFNDEINDDLFEQYYLQVQNITDNQIPANSNYQRKFFRHTFAKINMFNRPDVPDSKFCLNFFKQIVQITNDDNYAKLILNLLNVLSLWFDLGVFDLNVYFSYFILLVGHAFKLLCKLTLRIERYILTNL